MDGSNLPGTTGYNITMDLRYHWMIKRFQGSHLANRQSEMWQLLLAGKLIHVYQAFSFDEIGFAQLMYENKHPYGNMAVW